MEKIIIYKIQRENVAFKKGQTVFCISPGNLLYLIGRHKRNKKWSVYKCDMDSTLIKGYNGIKIEIKSEFYKFLEGLVYVLPIYYITRARSLKYKQPPTPHPCTLEHWKDVIDGMPFKKRLKLLTYMNNLAHEK